MWSEPHQGLGKSVPPNHLKGKTFMKHSFETNELICKACGPKLPVTALLFTGVLAWGQLVPGNAHPRDVVNNKGQKAHLLLSTNLEAAHHPAGQSIGSAPTATRMVYGGGPVMRNPTNYLIFWQ